MIWQIDKVIWFIYEIIRKDKLLCIRILSGRSDRKIYVTDNLWKPLVSLSSLSRTLIGGGWVLPLSKEAVGVFYIPSRLGKFFIKGK